MALDITIEKYKDFPVVVLKGRVIGDSSDKLKKTLESVFNENSIKIILDISEIEFIDSNGLGIIIYYHTHMQKSGRKLILYIVNPDPLLYINRLLEFTKLINIFNIITTLEDSEK